MTIQEAIKANETKRVGRKGADKNWWFEIGTLSGTMLSANQILDEWFVEPEKIEFECKWESCMGLIIPTYANKDMSSLIGKRTRVTVEVINE